MIKVLGGIEAVLLAISPPILCRWQKRLFRKRMAYSVIPLDAMSKLRLNLASSVRRVTAQVSAAFSTEKIYPKNVSACTLQALTLRFDS